MLSARWKGLKRDRSKKWKKDQAEQQKDENNHQQQVSSTQQQLVQQQPHITVEYQHYDNEQDSSHYSPKALAALPLEYDEMLDCSGLARRR